MLIRRPCADDRSFHGFTLVELLVVIAVIVILIALLLPAISASRASSRTAKCGSQVSEVGNALHRAGMDRVTAVPGQWAAAIAPYLDDAGVVLHCPDDFERPTGVSYGLNARTFRMSGGDSHRIVALDYRLSLASVVGPQGADDWPMAIAPRHRGQVNVLYFDNSVRLRRPDDIDPRVCRIHDETWRPTRDSKMIRPGCSTDVSLSPPASTTTGGTTTTSTTTGGTTTGGPTCSPGVYVVIDDKDPAPAFAATGVWANDTSFSPFAGGKKKANENNGIDTATFTPNITQAGSYSVYLWWDGNWDRSATVKVTVNHKNGSSVFTVNQQTNNLGWENKLGTFAFNAGQTGNVVISTEGAGASSSFQNFAIADAVRFECAASSGTTTGGTTTGGLNPCQVPPDPTPGGQIDLGLDWLKRHQQTDGRFSFLHATNISGCNCPNQGTTPDADMGATGLALLCFLGSGYSYNTPGPYQDTICRAVTFIVNNRLQNTPVAGASLFRLVSNDNDNRHYGHFIAQWALAEALILGDRSTTNGCGSSSCTVSAAQLRQAVQEGTYYTTYAVDNGGWRYYRPTPWPSGDMSHSMFALAAQGTAYKAGINDNTSNPLTLYSAVSAFLDARQTNIVSDPNYNMHLGKYYRYLTTYATTPSMSCAGLLSRRYIYEVNPGFLYKGARRNHPAVVEFMNEITGPEMTTHNIYENMHLSFLAYLEGGATWDNWYGQMSTYLQGIQDTSNTHLRGSYYTGTDGNSVSGGRLYFTTFSILSLVPKRGGLRILEP